jgi:N-acetylglutamate synthase-like GNAT family acetyltransferase
MEGSQPKQPATTMPDVLPDVFTGGMAFDGPRAPTDAEWSKVIEFLNRNLRPGQSWSIADEYPSSLNRTQAHNMRIIVENGEVIAHAVLKPIILKTPVGIFKVGGIGSVVTNDRYRNQGHSTRIIESCIEAAENADCDFAILWTDLYDFYRRMGFELGGSETTVLIDRELALTTSFKFNDSNRIAPDAVLRVFQQHSVSSHRTLDDVRASLAIPNTRVSTAWDTTGKLAAYAIEGKGADLNGYVHEWGGSTSALLALLTHMRAQQKRDLRIIAPAHAVNLVSRLAELGCTQHSGFLGMLKILKTEALFTKLNRYARALGISDLVLEVRDGRSHFGRGTQVYSTDSDADLLRLLFGPEKPSAIHKFDAVTAEAFDEILPIPIWVWGWDSV